MSENTVNKGNGKGKNGLVQENLILIFKMAVFQVYCPFSHKKLPTLMWTLFTVKELNSVKKVCQQVSYAM